MVPSNLRKLLRIQSQSAIKAFSELRGPIPPFPQSAFTPLPQIANSIDVLPFSDLSKSEFSKRDNFYAYPSLSLGFFLNPISSTSLVRSQLDDEAITDDSNVIRADSVKKKRKKKMNKHKLKKLRKRLRRKS